MKSPVVSGVIAAALSALLLAAIAVVGCGGSLPDTPEALFAKWADANAAGNHAKAWDLSSNDRREKFMSAIDAGRKTIRDNPGMRDMITNQFKSTAEDFFRLSYVELWCRENRGNERSLVGAKIVDKQPDPRKPDETLLTIELAGGARAQMRVRQTADGFAIVDWQNMGPPR